MNFDGGLFASRDGGRSWKAMSTPEGRRFASSTISPRWAIQSFMRRWRAWRFNSRPALERFSITDIMRRVPRGETLAILVAERNGNTLRFFTASTFPKHGGKTIFATAPPVKGALRERARDRRNMAGLVEEIKNAG